MSFYSLRKAIIGSNELPTAVPDIAAGIPPDVRDLPKIAPDETEGGVRFWEESIPEPENLTQRRKGARFVSLRLCVFASLR